MAHFWSCSPTWHWNPRANGWTGRELWLVVKGEGSVRRRRNGSLLYDLKPGSCMAFHMDRDYYVTGDSDRPLSIYGIHFSLKREDQEQFGPRIGEHHFFEEPDLIRRLMARVVLFHDRGNRESRDLYFMTALEEFMNPSEEKDAQERYSSPAMNRLARHIEKHDKILYSLDEMARIAGCSPNTLMRLVKRETGLTPVNYRNHLKMERAKQYLHATNLTVADISDLLGYSDYRYFCRVFKKHTGKSPGGFKT